MVKTLNTGAIGVTLPDLATGLDLAAAHGFRGLEIDPSMLDGGSRDLAAAKGVSLEAFGLSVEWRQDEATFRDGLAKLPALAEKATAAGMTRCATWVLPGRDGLGYDACTRFHRDRFRPVAEILGERGISLGLEFIGPKHLRDPYVFPWIYSLHAMLDFGVTVGPNVGVLLDAYHWHTSGGTIDDLLAVDPKRVVLVHLNDALPNLARHELPDGTRDLPGATGVIDLPGFLGALREIGYEGPASCEPFKKDLATLPDDHARLTAVSSAMDSVLG